MIRVQYKDRRYAPVIVCDICEQRITEVNMAVAVYPSGSAEESELLEVWHVHKQHCLPIADERLGGRTKVGWDELMNHLLSLTNNCGFTAKDFAARAEAFEEFRDPKLE